MFHADSRERRILEHGDDDRADDLAGRCSSPLTTRVNERVETENGVARAGQNLVRLVQGSKMTERLVDGAVGREQGRGSRLAVAARRC
jgi:hypothetical protein